MAADWTSYLELFHDNYPLRTMFAALVGVTDSEINRLRKKGFDSSCFFKLGFRSHETAKI